MIQQPRIARAGGGGHAQHPPGGQGKPRGHKKQRRNGGSYESNWHKFLYHVEIEIKFGGDEPCYGITQLIPGEY
jgi:hypothetical protein